MVPRGARFSFRSSRPTAPPSGSASGGNGGDCSGDGAILSSDSVHAGRDAAYAIFKLQVGEAVGVSVRADLAAKNLAVSIHEGDDAVFGSRRVEQFRTSLIRAVSVAAKGDGDNGEPDLRWLNERARRFGRERVNRLLETQVRLLTERAVAAHRAANPGYPRNNSASAAAAGESGNAAAEEGGDTGSGLVEVRAVRRPLLIAQDSGLSEGFVAGYDTTGDGEIDQRVPALGLDTLNDGTIDTVGLDTNGNGDYETTVPLAVAGRSLLHHFVACSVAVPFQVDSGERSEWENVPFAEATAGWEATSQPPQYDAGGDCVAKSLPPPPPGRAQRRAAPGPSFRKGGAVQVAESGLRGRVVRLTRAASGTAVVLVRMDLDGRIRPWPGQALLCC
mmetsp:Transcript_19952/g.39603  ORF Transcript_19952/g.39603 Transcript_19952/m.39603 type:complete len:390 (-) Transcript_19952:128-1297(-)